MRNEKALFLLFALAAVLFFIGYSVLAHRSFVANVIAVCGTNASSTCVQRVAIAVEREGGFAATAELLRAWYVYDAHFRPDCYIAAVQTGRGIFADSPDFRTLYLSQNSVICNFGLYHGYAAALIDSTKSPDAGQKFCEYVGERLNASSHAAQAECFRGLGRELPLLDRSKNRTEASMAKAAVSACRNISTSDELYQYCISGAFNRLGRAKEDPSLGLSGKSETLSVCESQDPRTMPECLADHRWAIALQVMDLDAMGLPLPQSVTDGMARLERQFGVRAEELGVYVINALGYDEARNGLAKAADYPGFIRECAAFSQKLTQSCIEGYALGLAKNSMPFRQHVALFNFCSAAAAGGVTAQQCLTAPMNYLRGFYTASELSAACSQLKYRFNIGCEEL